MDWVLLAVAFVIILAGAELFTNGVEWVGDGFGLSEGAVGSVLAAVGTAVPETVLPFIAILLSGGDRGEEIGIGAILGAPFMLTTLAMFVLGVAVLIPSVRRASSDLRGDRRVIRHDLAYFLAMYALAVVAGLWHFTPYKVALAVALLVGYAFYVRRHFAGTREDVVEAEAVGEIRPLYFMRLRGGAASGQSPPQSLSVIQSLVSLGLIIGGAKLFVDEIDVLAERLGVPRLAFALLVAPLATELPEKFNSVIWVRRGKDTLALGNLTGAMVFQSSFPVTIGLLLTPWRLSNESLVAALVALAAGLLLYTTLRRHGPLPGGLLLFHGLFYAGYVTYVVTRL